MSALALLVALAGSQASRDQTFGASVVNVFVDAFVTSGGEAVTGLGPDDFELRDEGVVQRITVVKRGDVPLYAVLAFDTSDSVGGEKLKDLVEAGQGLLAALKPQDQVVLLTFSHELLLRSEPGEARLQIVSRLKSLQGQGATSLYDAADAALSLANQGSHAIVLLFTDGLDTSSWLGPDQVLRAAARATSVVYAVGTNAEAEPHLKFLKSLAETTGGRVLWAGSTRNLASTFLRVLRDVRSRYLLGYEPTGSAKPGWHAISIRVRTRTGEVRARRGYFMRE